MIDCTCSHTILLSPGSALARCSSSPGIPNRSFETFRHGFGRKSGYLLYVRAGIHFYAQSRDKKLG